MSFNLKIRYGPMAKQINAVVVQKLTGLVKISEETFSPSAEDKEGVFTYWYILKIYCPASDAVTIRDTGIHSNSTTTTNSQLSHLHKRLHTAACIRVHSSHLL